MSELIWKIFHCPSKPTLEKSLKELKSRGKEGNGRSAKRKMNRK